MIKAVIFDIDNTLYSYDGAHEVAFAALTEYAVGKLGLQAEEFKSLHDNVKKGLEKTMKGHAALHNRLIRYQNMLEQKQISLYPHVLRMHDIYWNTLIDNMIPSEGAVDTFRTLREMGLKIGIGTDMDAEIQFKKLEKLELLQYVDFIVSSEEALAEKPDPKLLEYCCRKAGCQAQECMFVGDSLKKDALGAAACGMVGVWYAPDSIAALPENVIRITSLKETVKLVNKH